MNCLVKSLAGAALLFASTLAAQAELYRVASIAPGTTPFVVNTAIAKIASKYTEDIDLQVRATGAATQHFVEAGQGKIDFLFNSASINMMMVNQTGPFVDFPDNLAIEENVGAIFSYQMGPYHFVTNADSGIETLEDIKGRTVFAGPPGGAATVYVVKNIEAATGLKAGEDYEVVQFGFDAATQAFQDGKIDMIVLPSNVPNPLVEQFALTGKIRLVDVDMDRVEVDHMAAMTLNEIAPDAYGDNQVNEEPVRTWGAMVNFSAGMHVPEDVVYELTKAIWEHRDELVQAAKWMETSIRIEDAATFIPSRLHPGARRYYEEIGLTIEEPLQYR